MLCAWDARLIWCPIFSTLRTVMSNDKEVTATICCVTVPLNYACRPIFYLFFRFRYIVLWRLSYGRDFGMQWEVDKILNSNWHVRLDTLKWISSKTTDVGNGLPITHTIISSNLLYALMMLKTLPINMRELDSICDTEILCIYMYIVYFQIFMV